MYIIILVICIYRRALHLILNKEEDEYINKFRSFNNMHRASLNTFLFFVVYATAPVNKDFD